MATAKKPAATARKGEAEAAMAETNGHKPHEVEVQGITFVLPAEVPFAAMLASRTLVRTDEQDAQAMTFAMLDLAEAYVGDQIHRLDRLPASEGSGAVVELLDRADEIYGTDAGESSASSGS
jgi:hypothetical protein